MSLPKYETADDKLKTALASLDEKIPKLSDKEKEEVKTSS